VWFALLSKPEKQQQHMIFLHHVQNTLKVFMQGAVLKRKLQMNHHLMAT